MFPVRTIGWRHGDTGDNVGGDFFGDMGLVAVELPRRGLPPVAHVRVSGRDATIFGHSLADRGVLPLLFLNILREDPGQKTGRLGTLRRGGIVLIGERNAREDLAGISH